MTDYERFREKLKERIQELSGTDAVIEYSDIRKNNGNHYEGLSIMGLEDRMLPILNIRDYYHYYLERNRNMDDVMERVRKTIADQEGTDDDLIGLVPPFEEARKNIHYGLINYEANMQRLNGLVHRRFLDLAIVLYYTVYKDDGHKDDRYNRIIIKKDSIKFKQARAVRFRGTKEIDFVGVKGSHRLYIQVAYLLPDEQTVDREFGNLLEIPDNYPKYVVTMDEMQNGGNYQGIKQVHLRDFLLAEDKERL